MTRRPGDDGYEWGDPKSDSYMDWVLDHADEEEDE